MLVKLIKMDLVFFKFLKHLKLQTKDFPSIKARMPHQYLDVGATENLKE